MELPHKHERSTWATLRPAALPLSLLYFTIVLRTATTYGFMTFTPTLSVDCSPPRGCYASTQRIQYNFNCAPRYAVAVERISMDLNGNVLKHEIPESYVVSNDEAANRVLSTFCGPRDRD